MPGKKSTYKELVDYCREALARNDPDAKMLCGLAYVMPSKTRKAGEPIVYAPGTIEIPNMDAEDSETLRHFWGKWHHASRAQAVQLVGVRKGASRLAHTLANYAINKSVAMTAREKGDIQTAAMYENICERIYKTLPQDLKW